MAVPVAVAALTTATYTEIRKWQWNPWTWANSLRCDHLYINMYDMGMYEHVREHWTLNTVPQTLLSHRDIPLFILNPHWNETKCAAYVHHFARSYLIIIINGIHTRKKSSSGGGGRAIVNRWGKWVWTRKGSVKKGSENECERERLVKELNNWLYSKVLDTSNLDLSSYCPGLRLTGVSFGSFFLLYFSVFCSVSLFFCFHCYSKTACSGAEMKSDSLLINTFEMDHFHNSSQGSN